MKADYILKSKSVFDAVSGKPYEGFIAVGGSKIIKTGKGDDYEECIGAETEIIDLGDKTVSPGFIDSHTHFYMGALTYSERMNTELINSTSEEECVTMMKEYEKEHPDYDRLIGSGWYLAFWDKDALPSKDSLDEAFPDKPVYLANADAHTLWLNTKAMEEAGYTNDVKDDPNIVRDENGELTGVFKEAVAIDIQSYKMAKLDNSDYMKVIVDGLKSANEMGITSVSEMSGYDYIDYPENLYGMTKQLEEQGDLSARIHIYPELVSPDAKKEMETLRGKYGSDKVKFSGLKGFLDGVAATYTAYLVEPYSDMPETCGLDVPKISAEDLEKAVLAANKNGFPVRLHAIGDGAVRMALDAYEKSAKQGLTENITNVIEHIEEIMPEDIPRFKQIGVLGCMQPSHLLLDYEEKPIRVGERARYMWAHRTLLDAGMELAFSTDYPVIPFDPYRDLYVATTRKTPDGQDTGTNQEEEKITLPEALIAYTRTSAKALGRNDIGTLEEGKFADIVVSGKDLFACDLEALKDVRPFMTIMDGKIVYKSS